MSGYLEISNLMAFGKLIVEMEKMVLRTKYNGLSLQRKNGAGEKLLEAFLKDCSWE